jgi:hypothetical protein
MLFSPFIFLKENPADVLKKISESLYICSGFRAGLNCCWFFLPCANIFDVFFYLFQLEEKKKNARGILKLIKTIGGIAQMFRHFPPAGIV